MTVDLLDQAFLDAAAKHGPGLARPVGDLKKSPNIRPEIVADLPATTGETVVAAETVTAAGDSSTDTVDPTLLRLIDHFSEQWASVVTAVEEARRAGTQVIAIAGHQPGEGRTTLVQGLSLLLAKRGWQVACFGSASAWWQELVGDAASWQDRLPRLAAADDLVLVDAGIWFPPGPLRPQQLTLKMFGFDGVVLVRRHALPPNPARDAAIAKGGLQAIGEIVNFMPAFRQRAA
ncbi:MAG: hypothetical protein ACO37F_14585 [Pirellulales bacterium]|jgi:hypothetical protein